MTTGTSAFHKGPQFKITKGPENEHSLLIVVKQGVELSWVYLAKVKKLKDEKETIAIAKTSGHRKNRKVIESLPLDWSIKVHSKPNLHRIG